MIGKTSWNFIIYEYQQWSTGVEKMKHELELEEEKPRKTFQNKQETSPEKGEYWTKETFVTQPWI